MNKQVSTAVKDAATQGGIQVIDRLCLILNAIASNGGNASLKIIAAETGLHPSTCFRILAAAASNGLVERNGAGHYQFGGQLAQWATLRRTGADLRELARPVMAWLRDQVEETVNLTRREGDEVVYIERATPKRMMRVEQVIGSRAPLHVTAVGKLMLGVAGQDSVKQYAARTGLPAYTPHTLTRTGLLWSAVRRDLAAGYALDDEEAEIGVGCIGVLLRDRAGEVVGGLSISAPIERRQTEWIALIQDAAHRIEALLEAVA